MSIGKDFDAASIFQEAKAEEAGKALASPRRQAQKQGPSRKGRLKGFTLAGGAATEDEAKAPASRGATLPADDTQRIAESFLTEEGRQETRTQKRMRDTTTLEGFMAAFDKVRIGRLTRGEEGNDLARQTAIDRANQRIKDGLGLDSEWVRNELRMLTQAQTDKAVDESLSAPFGPTEIGKTPGENYEPGPVTRFLSEAGQNLGKDVVRAYTTGIKGAGQLLGQPTDQFTAEGFEDTTGGQIAKGAASAVPFFTPGLGQVSAAEGVFSGALDLASGRGLWKAVNQVVPVEMALKTFDPKATTEERAAGLTALALLGHTAMKSGGRAARSVSEGLGKVADKLKAASEPEARIFGEQLGKAVDADPAKFDEAASVLSKLPEQEADDLLKTVTKDAGAAPVSEVSPTSAQDVLPTGAKQPWQMTRDEARNLPAFKGMANDGKGNTNPDRVTDSWHRLRVSEALNEGKPVPPEVLADYPDLAQKFVTKDAPQAAKEPWQMTRGEFIQNNPTLNGPMREVTLQEFRDMNGYRSPLDDHGQFRYPHGISKAERSRIEARQRSLNAEYDKSLSEYERLKSSGELPQTQTTWSADFAVERDGQHAAGYRAAHKRAINKALSEGKPVPPEVLADYPDLAQKYGKPASAIIEPDVKTALSGERGGVRTGADRTGTDDGSGLSAVEGGQGTGRGRSVPPEPGAQVRTRKASDQEVAPGTPEVPGQAVLSPDQGTIAPDAGAPREPQGVRRSGQVPEGEPLGIAHADTGQWRAENGLDPYVKTRYKVNQYSEEAVGRGHADNALSIADQVNSGQKTSADRFEQEGLRLGFHKVKLELKDIEAAKSDAIEAGDPAALAEAETAYQDAMGRGDRITKALDKVGSEAGGTLGARAYDLIDEGDSLDLRRKVQSTTGEKVSAKDQARLDEVAAKVKALEAEVDRLTKLTSDPNRILRQPSRGGKANLTGRAGRVSQADFQAAKDKLLTVVKPGSLGAGFGGFEINWTAEHSAALRTAVRYIVQNTPGLRNLEQPYEGLKSKVQEMFGDIPDHLLRQAVADELGSPRAVTREQMTARAKENAARRQARRAVTEIVEEAKDRQRTFAQKAAREVAGVLSAPRRMMTFLDVSAMGRQGLYLATTHPQAAAKAFVRQWEVVKKDGFDTVMGRLENDPLYDEFRGAGGYLADPLNGVREEGFVHSFLDKIPGLNKAMQGSEELMAAYLNVLRFESYKALRNGLSIGGHEPTVPELKWAAGMVNVASGRGIGPGEGGKASRVANQFFFSPQLLVARMRMATGEQAVQGFRASGRAGALASAEYAKYLAARAALATLLASVGGKTETDVKDKEFGQTRFGKLKVETSGGMDASAGLVWGTLAQALERTPAPYGKDVVGRVGRFLGNRLSPVAGYVRGAVDKKDFKGDPFQPGREAVKMLGPIHIVNQIDGSLDKEGAKPEDRAKMLILETFGFSTSFYGTNQAPVRKSGKLRGLSVKPPSVKP